MNHYPGRYYTTEPSSSLLVDGIDTACPSTLIDLGFGSGSLTKAAINRWPEIRATCVDLAPERDIIFPGVPLSKYRYTQVDVLTPRFENLSAQNDLAHDVIISNPPFHRRTVTAYIRDVLDSAGLSSVLERSSTTFASHCGFLAQSLRNLNENNEVAIILPESFVSGESYSRARAALLDQYHLRKVTELPPNSFCDTEAKCYALYIKAKRDQDGVHLQRAGSFECIRISPRQGAHRLDYKYYEGLPNAPITRAHREVCTLESAGFEVQRGRLSAKDAPNHTHVCHTSTIRSAQTDTHKRLFLSRATGSRPKGTMHIMAEPGDIVVSRVGSRVVGEMALVTSGQAILTDCVFRVRPSTASALTLAGSIVSGDIASYLRRIARGTCARYLTKDDIRHAPIVRPLS
ncbi:N-6 DNA methylase [Thioalkalivibrio sp. ALE16]|uniref:N-6 DNA methylase n=1 Tax=Thioalkalivibrio sp. ALE16 TaxID=1158172 RepID=UPI0009DC05C5